MDTRTYWENKFQKPRNTSPETFAYDVVDFLKGKPVTNILDLGSGFGFDSELFLEHKYDVTALDVAQSTLDSLHDRQPSIETICSDLKHLTLPAASFDSIYAHLSLHYFNDEDTDKIFTSISNILRPGGYLFVKCKSVKDKLYGQGERIGPDMFKGNHIRHFFSEEYMRKKIDQSRLNVLDIQETEGQYGRHYAHFIEAYAQKGK